MPAASDLYQEQILDHYKHPKNKGPLPGATFSARDTNPLCGDEVAFHLKVDRSQRVSDVRFEGRGCAISQASASMLTEAVAGKSLQEAEGLADRFRGMMEGKVEPEEESFGDLVALRGVVKYPVRIKCAVLAWDVLQEALGGAGRAAEASH